MTDNEIIKAFECCYAKGKTCNDCPTNDFECTNIEKMALDLINRQKAEIERLECSAKDWEETARQLFISRENIKAEAVKEFAERFENELTKIEEIYFDEEHENFISANKVIALLVNLVKERVGEG